MNILNDKNNEKNTKKDKSLVSNDLKGYERPLFQDSLPKWSDDQMGGVVDRQQIEVKYHDKEMVLKVANGLCYDIFFRADDVYRPDFDEIPDFFEEVDIPNRKEKSKGKFDRKKPLDSKNKNRTYLLSPDAKEEEKVEKTKKKHLHRRRGRRSGTNKRRSAGGNKSSHNARNRKMHP